MSTVSLLRRLLIGLSAVALLCIAAIYGLSAWRLQRTYETPLVPLRSAQGADPTRGMHIAKVVGCWVGCHGKEGEGGDTYVDVFHTQVAPTLSQVLPQYSDEELARLVRFGVKRDGRSAVGMISDTFWALSDQDLADTLAFLRRQPNRPPVQRRLDLTLRGHLALATGEWKPSADRVDASAPRWGELARTSPFERGRYLASITCSECHGVDFNGNRFEGGPSLAILGKYRLDEFRHLMRTGRPIGGRKIPKMTWLADVELSEGEIADLYAFLREHHHLGSADGPASPDASDRSRR